MAADKIEDDLRALSTDRRANLCRQVLAADDQLLRDGLNRRVRARHAIVGADHAGAKASSDLSGGAADAASSADQQHRLPALRLVASIQHHRS
jgi:hypothetical protein